MNRLTLNQQGVSIVELLITITLISALSILLMNFMVNWLQQHTVTQTRTALLTGAQDSLDVITENIRLSASADQNNRWLDPYAPNAPTNELSWQSDANTLVLASAVEDTDGNILFSDASNYISHKNNQIFFVQNGILYRRTLAAPVAGNKAKNTCPPASATINCPADRRLANNVIGFTVNYLNVDNQNVTPTNARSIELTLTLQKELFGQQIQSTDKTRMVFRND